MTVFTNSTEMRIVDGSLHPRRLILGEMLIANGSRKVLSEMVKMDSLQSSVGQWSVRLDDENRYYVLNIGMCGGSVSAQCTCRCRTPDRVRLEWKADTASAGLLLLGGSEVFVPDDGAKEQYIRLFPVEAMRAMARLQA